MPKVQHISEIKPTGRYTKADASRVLNVTKSTILNRVKPELGLLKLEFVGVKELVTGESIIRLYESKTGKSLDNHSSSKRG